VAILPISPCAEDEHLRDTVFLAHFGDGVWPKAVVTVNTLGIKAFRFVWP
jgi:hypothetical protein